MYVQYSRLSFYQILALETAYIRKYIQHKNSTQKYRVGQKSGGSDTISACVSLPPNFWPTLYFNYTSNATLNQ